MLKLKPNFFDYVVNDTYADWRLTLCNHALFFAQSLAFIGWLSLSLGFSFGASGVWYVLCVWLFKLVANGVVSFLAYQKHPRLTPLL